jgi:hypothetical protein
MAEVFCLLKRVNKEHLLQPIPADEAKNAVEIMAEVRAYYECEPRSCSKIRSLLTHPFQWLLGVLLTTYRGSLISNYSKALAAP